MQHEQSVRVPRLMACAVLSFALVAATAPTAHAALTQLNIGDDGYTESDISPTKRTSYVIKYHLNGGDQPLGQTVRVFKGQSLAVSKLKKPTRPGYTFAGWYTTSSLKTAATKVQGVSTTSKRTLYAKWKKASTSQKAGTYVIRYHLRGGKQAANQRTTFTKSTATFTLKSPTRACYTFAGWYTNSSLTKKITKVAKGTAKNLDLYAKWKWKGANYAFFGQNDKTSDWYNLPYWSGKNIGGSGCGLVSYTMAIDILTKGSYTPRDMYYLRGGLKGSWRGSDLTGSSTNGQLESPKLTHSQFSEKYFGVKQVTMKKLDFSTPAKKTQSVNECIEKMKDGLMKGYVYLVSRGGGKCFMNSDGVWEYHGGHYVIFYKYDAKRNVFYSHDPSGNVYNTISKHRAVKYSISDMKKCIGFRAGHIGYLYNAL
ncbi:MAG: InlB B-repeat-containing protein [Coriobacteriia bacterium]|nr:InlB B-repeat-containing protein [Coriobacteriia bacterium]